MKTPRTFVFALFAALVSGPSLLAQTTAAAPKKEDDVLVLSPFEVNADDDTGYQATETLAGTRIRTNLKDVGSAIQVVTKDMMNDIGAVDAGTLLQYTTNTEVAGTRGTYTGLGNGTTLDESANLRSPQGAQRVRGLASADNTRDYYITDIPWDGYNISRVDILRGPNSFLFGLGSPAGIVNASLRGADFGKTGGNVELRVGSYGSTRESLDWNQVLIPKVLSLRFDALWDQQKYEQEQAFQNQQRYYGALRFDPKLFKAASAMTSIKIKAEDGKIDANRPRSVALYDSITPWWTSMGQLSLANPYVAGSNPRGVNPWITAVPGNVQQPVWLIDGGNNQLYQIYGGTVNTGALNPTTGQPQGASAGIAGMNYNFEQFGLTNVASYAVNANLPNAGNYRSQSLRDSSIFNFYDTLIDGPTKSEWERWDAFNVNATQTFLNDRIGIDLTYDHQKYRNGNQALLGGAPQLTIDILKTQADQSTNVNFGRPYVIGGPGYGGSTQTERTVYRASVFGEFRPTDFFKNSTLLTLLGKQTINGVFSREQYQNESRSWQMYATSQAWAGYIFQNAGNTVGIGERTPTAIIYLGSSLANKSTMAGANIPGIAAPVVLGSGNVYTFASTWKNNPGVVYSDPWTVPANLTPMFSSATLTQASNPANYVGWNNNFHMDTLAYNNGEDQSLLTRAQQALRETQSYSGSYQGKFLADSLIATIGWRYDQVKTKDITAKQNSLNRSILDLSPQNYALPAEFPANQIKSGHSLAKSFVFDVNKVFAHFMNHDPIPLNIGFTYNDSSNFQVTNVRRDIYGNPVSDPTGHTRDYGLWLSTKDGKFSLRAVKFKTEVAGNDSGLGGIAGNIGGLVQQGLKWRNVFLYQLGAYDLGSADGGSYRNTWTNAYPDEANPQAMTDASITGWNNIQKWLDAKGFFKVWNFTPVPDTYLVDRTTYLSDKAKYTPPTSTVYSYTASAPQGFVVTADTVSQGYEFEFTYNPLPNWRIAFNASETTATRTNFGGEVLDEFMAYMKEQLVKSDGTPTPAGMLPNFGGPSMYLNNWVGLNSTYTLLKAQSGANVPEIRKWRYNIITNYTFNRGTLKGLGVGGAYRWQDKVGIGYPLTSTGSYVIDSPYYGPSEDGIDLWVSYEHKITKKINWKGQLNVRNAFAKDGLIPISVQPDGSWAAARVKPVQEWFLTNTFTF